MRHKEAYLATEKEISSVLGHKTALKFRCTGCGNCCLGPGTVYFTPTDIKNIIKHLGLGLVARRSLLKKLVLSEENGYLLHKPSKACMFLDSNNMCKVYPVRPMQCSTFPFWQSTFESKSSLVQTAKNCPGFGSENSQLFSPMSVARRVNKTIKEFLSPQTDKENSIQL